MWSPNDEDLKQLLTLLSNSQSVDNRVQQQVFGTLRTFEDRPDFYRYLLFIIRQLRNSLDIHIITTALTIFKNNLFHVYKLLDAHAQIEIKNLTLELITSDNEKFRSFAGNILAVIASGSFSHLQEILPRIAQMINSGETGVTISYFQTLEKICEDLSQYADNSSSDSPLFVLSAFLISFLSFNKNDYRNHWSFRCLNILLPITSDFILSSDFQCVKIACCVIIYDDCSTPSAISFLTTLCDISFTDIQNYFNDISTALINFLTNDSYTRVFLVAEFWNVFFEHKSSKDLARPILGQLIKNLLKNCIFTENDHLYSKFVNNEIDDDEDEMDPSRLSEGDSDYSSGESDLWTLRKSSASTIDRIAEIYQLEVFPYIGSILEYVNDSDWMKQEAGILAIGAISKGCEPFAHEYFPRVFPIIIKDLNSPLILIRSISVWALSRYAEFYNDLEPIYIQQAVTNTIQLLTDKSTNVKSNALFALVLYIEACGDIMSDFCPILAEKLYLCLKTYKGKVVRELYEFIGRAAKYLPDLSKNPIFRQNVVTEILERLIINADEFEIIDLLLLDLICNLTQAHGMILVPYAGHVLNYCNSTVKQTLSQICASSENADIGFPDLDYMSASLDVIGSFIINYGENMLPHVKNPDMINMLIYSCQLQDNSIKESAFCCLDGIFVNFPDIIMPEVNRILPLIISCDMKNCYSSLMLLDKIIWNIKTETYKYFDVIFQKIFDLLTIDPIYGYKEKKARKNLISILYQLSSYCPDQIRPHANKIIFFLIQHLSSTRDPDLVHPGFYSLFLILIDNPDLFRMNFIRVYDLFASYNNTDNQLYSAFQNMIISNRNKISPQEWAEIHNKLPPFVQNKLHSLYGL